jgi:hypothetical protein
LRRNRHAEKDKRDQESVEIHERRKHMMALKKREIALKKREGVSRQHMR